jgi:phosphate/sulfate permease
MRSGRRVGARFVISALQFVEGDMRTWSAPAEFDLILILETVRNIAMAWVLTLPASIMLAAFLFWLFRHLL